MDTVVVLAECPHVDVNWQDSEGNTALITAAQAGKSQFILPSQSWGQRAAARQCVHVGGAGGHTISARDINARAEIDQKSCSAAKRFKKRLVGVLAHSLHLGQFTHSCKSQYWAGLTLELLQKSSLVIISHRASHPPFQRWGQKGTGKLTGRRDMTVY